MEREHAANAVAREFLGLYDEDCQFANQVDGRGDPTPSKEQRGLVNTTRTPQGKKGTIGHESPATSRILRKLEQEDLSVLGAESVKRGGTVTGVHE